MPRLIFALLIALPLALSGCDNAETRAEKHYQAGLALLEKGDIDRALVEFRNVFQLNGRHKEARLTYARLLRERGESSEAYSQYLLLAEQFPDNAEARLALAEMAISLGDWREAERHGRVAAKLAPGEPMAQMIETVLDYQAAIVARDRGAGAAPAARAQVLLETHAGNVPLALLAYRVLIDRALTGIDPSLALPILDQALALDPKQLGWHMLKLRLLNERGDKAAVKAHLAQLYPLFPDNQTVRDTTIAWYLREGDADGAEAFLRQLAKDAAASTAPDAARQAQQARLNVVQFLGQARGAAAARAEIEVLLAAEPGNPAFVSARAAVDFDAGQQEAAVASLEELLRAAADGEDSRNAKVVLAQMLQTMGRTSQAQARIDEVLVVDPSHVEALKLKAGWLIAQDKPGDAIIALRTALDQDPRNASVLTLMGQAHERDGARDLAGERYGLAMEVSGRAVAESLRYAQFLMAADRLDSAASVLVDALRVNPQSPPLLIAQAELAIRQRDWEKAAASVAALRALAAPELIARANQLGARLLLSQERIDETIAFLDNLAKSGDADRSAVASVVQAQIAAGQLEAARDYLDRLLGEAPQDAALRFLRAGLYVLEDQPAQAEAIYRDLLAAKHDSLRVLQALYRLMRADGREAEAAALLGDALRQAPSSPVLNLLQAAALEEAGDVDGALAIYEALYARASDNPVVANNLASLLATYRSDAESLARAFAIAHRLRGSRIAAFQDTYGWIAYRRGEFDEALAALEPAAKGLARDAMVQAHLGLTYAALKRVDEARAQLTLALELAGAATHPVFEQARQALAGLEAAP